MNHQQVEHYVMRYLDATESQIIEKTPGKVTVKLSPAADKELTGRSYYWSFVERTGADPETMSFTFVFDPKQVEAEKEKHEAPAKAQPQPQSDSILGRYFGFVPTQARGRSLEEKLYFGSGRLEQIFQASKTRGQFVNLYEQPKHEQPRLHAPIAYTSYFTVNFKIEFVCDMKREELHSLAISLSTGEIYEEAYSKFLNKYLTPRLPANTHVKETISLERALLELEKHIERKIETYDSTWSYEAHDRLEEELSRIHGYYQELILGAEPEIKSEIEQQYKNRENEIRWQYEPRVQVSMVNCGVFHLIDETNPLI
jgi:hypothetical protein